MENQQGANRGSDFNPTWLGVVAVLFGVLLLASQSTELLKQLVIAPGTTAELGIAADCRSDELEEEGLSLLECQLLVSNVQISLASSPGWFRPVQIFLSLSSSLAAVLSVAVGMALVADRRGPATLAVPVFGLLILLDCAGFVAVLNTGPLLRAQYLWPALLWFFIHACLFTAALVRRQQQLASDD